MSREAVEALKNAIGRRLLQGPSGASQQGGSQQPPRRDDPVIEAEDAGLTDLTSAQPDDRDVTDFVEFRGICKPCTNGCGGGCAEGWFYRERKCVESCDKTGEVAKVLDSFSVCVCPEGMFRDKATQNCLACESGCAKCQSADQCEACDSGSYLEVNPLTKSRACVAACSAGFQMVPWADMNNNVKEMYTTDRKAKKKALRLLQTTTTTTTATDSTEDDEPTTEELAAEAELEARNPLEETEVFTAREFRGMCTPCLKNCDACANKFMLDDSRRCKKSCDKLTEKMETDATTGQKRCRTDTSPRLKIIWASKKEEADLMDADKVAEKKAAREAAATSGDADGDLLDAVALDTSVEEELNASDQGL
jgi:hypothetical protein